MLVKPWRHWENQNNFIWQSSSRLGLFFLFFIGFLNLAESLEAAVHPAPPSIDWGASTYSFAGAAAAMTTNQDALQTNPAGLLYYQDLNSMGGGWLEMPGDADRWSVSLIDGGQPVIGGMQYAWANNGELDRQTITLGAAYKTPYGCLGISGHAHRFRGVSEGRGWMFTNSIGVLIPLIQSLAIGIYSKSPYDFEKDKYLPPSWHFGVMYQYPQLLRASFEAGKKFQTGKDDWHYIVAGDILVQEYFAIRGGHRWDEDPERSFWSAGLALIAQKIEIAGVFVQTTGKKQSKGMGFDINLKF